MRSVDLSPITPYVGVPEIIRHDHNNIRWPLIFRLTRTGVKTNRSGNSHYKEELGSIH